MAHRDDPTPLRPAVHAGAAYDDEPNALRRELEALFLAGDGPTVLPWEGLSRNGQSEDPTPTPSTRLLGVMSPHIDYARGGSAYGWAYDRLLSETDADLFIILATAHQRLKGNFNVASEHFSTPLGVAQLDLSFVEQLQRRYAGMVGPEQASLAFDDPLPHRNEHSIELQAVLLQYVLGGRRDYSVVPILVDSFYPFILEQRQPDTDPVIADFARALQETAAACQRSVCYIGSVDLAHIGPQFGDAAQLGEGRLKRQWTDDQRLLATACAADAVSWFDHVAAANDQNRVCGLAPMYVMLQAMQAERGELLKYSQAVDNDNQACVSFASVAFY